MKETVLYYTPQSTKQSRTLKGILVRMGIRIRNISPQQVNQTVGMLAGVRDLRRRRMPQPTHWKQIKPTQMHCQAQIPPLIQLKLLPRSPSLRRFSSFISFPSSV